MTLRQMINEVMGVRFPADSSEECVHLTISRRKMLTKEGMSKEDIKCFQCRYGMPKSGCLGYTTIEHLEAFQREYGL